MASPAIIPNDRLDRDFYIVLEDFRDGAAFRETDEGIDHSTLIDDLLSGQYDRVLRVVAFNPVEGWSRDASEDVAHELERHITHEVSETLTDFIEAQLGRRVGFKYRSDDSHFGSPRIDCRLCAAPSNFACLRQLKSCQTAPSGSMK